MPPTFHRQRGSSLLVTIILLGVLSAIGAAAVMLSSQERINASAKSRYDKLIECANAAYAKIWAEMANNGPGYLTSSVQIHPLTLPDGTQFVPGHYNNASDGGVSMTNVTFTAKAGSGNNVLNERDCTNAACGLVGIGQTHGIVAHCTDSMGRQYEVEMAVRFAL